MNLKEFVRFCYGMFMGTSVHYIKPSKRHLWPTKVEKLDDGFSLFIGGSGHCGVLREGSRALLVNTNQGSAAETLQETLKAQGVEKVETVVLTSLYRDFSGGLPLFESADSILVPAEEARYMREQIGDLSQLCQLIRDEKTIQFGDETLRLLPMGRIATWSDLVVFLEKRSVLFLGALFFNGIHPVLHPQIRFNVVNWITQLRTLLDRFQPKVIVGAEGALATRADVEKFISYLEALTNESVEFQDCRKNFDWIEIPSHTSLEENFDLLREKVKRHTTLQ